MDWDTQKDKYHSYSYYIAIKLRTGLETTHDNSILTVDSYVDLHELSCPLCRWNLCQPFRYMAEQNLTRKSNGKEH